MDKTTHNDVKIHGFGELPHKHSLKSVIKSLMTVELGENWICVTSGSCASGFIKETAAFKVKPAADLINVNQREITYCSAC